jgi:hypothetical protein
MAAGYDIASPMQRAPNSTGRMELAALGFCFMSRISRGITARLDKTGPVKVLSL